jgi:membrane-associated phospholipid phosphatase
MHSNTPGKELLEILRTIYSPLGITIQGVAILCTYLLVTTNTDWHYLLWIQDLPLRKILFFGVMLGGVIPMFIVPSIFIVSSIFKLLQIRFVTGALFLSSILGWLLSSFYKAWTGRIQPLQKNGVFIDTSHDWNFGFLHHGIFWGWPSSHTTVAFAMSTALIFLYPKNKLVTFLAALYAFYVGFGVTTRIHWFSEFIAGALLGGIIGYAVAITLRRHIKKRDDILTKNIINNI